MGLGCVCGGVCVGVWFGCVVWVCGVGVWVLLAARQSGAVGSSRILLLLTCARRRAPVPQKYEDLKMRGVVAERHMLRAFGFVVHVEHPHRFVLNYCQMLQLGWVLWCGLVGRGVLWALWVPVGLGDANTCAPVTDATWLRVQAGSKRQAELTRGRALALAMRLLAGAGCSRRRGTSPMTACARRCACATRRRSLPAASSSPPRASSRCGGAIKK